MIGNSPTHTVPDGELILPNVQEESFYSSQVLFGPHQHTQSMAMDTSCSDCSSDDGKVYVSLEPERKLFAQVPSSPTLGKVWPAERINLHSWKNRHPKNWNSQDISNWIYYVCSKSKHMDSYKIQAENFNTLCGVDLCNMGLDGFVQREPNYGMDLFYCLQGHLKTAHYKAPNENIAINQFEHLACIEAAYTEPRSDNSAMWSSGAMLVGEDQDMELTDGNLKSLELLDASNPGSGIAVVGGKHYDFLSDDGFEDILHDSGYGSDDSGRSSTTEPSAPVPPPAHTGHPSYPPGVPPHVHTFETETVGCRSVPPPAHTHHAPEQMCERPSTIFTSTKPRGRPKRDSHTPGQRGRKAGQATKGTHLWEFIRDVIFDSRHNPDVIRWEDQEQGVFRIVNSSEIARLWGEKKNNPSMTYEKLSRAMRDYYKSAILRRVGSRKLVYAFGAKVFPHLVFFPSYEVPPIFSRRP